MKKRIVQSIAACLLLGAAMRTTASDFEGRISLNGKGVAHDAVVYLEGAKKSAPLTKAVIDQRNKTFSPHVSVVTVGTAIQFPNNDTVFHNVFAYFDAKKFDLGMYPHGASKSVTFDKKGLVSLLCNVHSEMSAYIMVVDTPYYGVTDRQGHFDIKEVPPGTYTLHVWHESGATLTGNVTIKAENAPLNLTASRK